MKNNPWNGTSFHNDIINMSYDELVERIGEPTYGEPSCDGKVQKEWQLMTDDNIAFTIYDWKEYKRDVTDGDVVEWHIGYRGGTNCRKIIKMYLEKFGINVSNNRMFN